MNKFIIPIIMVTILNASAQEETSKPCLEIKKACESAGYSIGKHKEGKGLSKDCMQKLRNGESVPGVTISVSVISACKEKRDERKK